MVFIRNLKRENQQVITYISKYGFTLYLSTECCDQFYEYFMNVGFDHFNGSVHTQNRFIKIQQGEENIIIYNKHI